LGAPSCLCGKLSILTSVEGHWQGKVAKLIYFFGVIYLCVKCFSPDDLKEGKGKGEKNL
jgi:hypothetical protein